MASGMVTVCRWPSGIQAEKELVGLGGIPPKSTSSFSACIPDGHLQRVTIPDAILIHLTS